jgi:hypothetical protein
MSNSTFVFDPASMNSGWVPLHVFEKKERYWRKRGFAVERGELSRKGRSRLMTVRRVAAVTFFGRGKK